MQEKFQGMFVICYNQLLCFVLFSDWHHHCRYQHLKAATEKPFDFFVLSFKTHHPWFNQSTYSTYLRDPPSPPGCYSFSQTAMWIILNLVICTTFSLTQSYWTGKDTAICMNCLIEMILFGCECMSTQRVKCRCISFVFWCLKKGASEWNVNNALPFKKKNNEEKQKVLPESSDFGKPCPGMTMAIGKKKNYGSDCRSEMNFILTIGEIK